MQLKLKYADFSLVTRQASLPSSTDDGQTLYRSALELLGRASPSKPIRLTGMSAQKLLGGGGQLALFAERDEKAERLRALNAALDSIADKYGSRAALPADVALEEER